jgi:hypothetical protein
MTVVEYPDQASKRGGGAFVTDLPMQEARQIYRYLLQRAAEGNERRREKRAAACLAS